MATMSDVRTIELRRGGTLAWAEYGDPGGEPVLFLHGCPGSRLDGVVLDTAARASGVRLICPDRPGYGESDRAPTYDLRAFPPVIRELLDTLEVDRIRLLAHSGGAPYGVATAAALRSRVISSGLVAGMGTNGTGVNRTNQLSVRLAHFARPTLRAYLAHHRFWEARDPEKTMAKLHGRRTPADQEIVEHLGIAGQLFASRQEATRRSLEGVVTDCNVFGQRWRFDLDKVSAHCNLWHGDADRTVDIVCSEELHRLLPKSSFTRLPGHGHQWIWANGRTVFDRLLGQ